MRGTHSQLIVTTSVDEATGAEVPLFAFPVQICKATSDPSEVKFDRAGPSGGELKRQEIDTVTGEVVEPDDVLRGVRTGDSFQEVEAEAIAQIEAATKLDDIRVIDTVALADIPFDRGCGVHFLQIPAKGGAATHFRLTYEALLPAKKKGSTPARPALALKVKYGGRTRQKFGVVYADPTREVLVLQQLVFGAQVRQPDEQVRSHLAVAVQEPMVAKVRAVLDGMLDEAADFDSPIDELIPAREALIETALAGDGTPVAPQAEAAVSPGEDVEAALEASLAKLEAVGA
jgi:non-homologous end joining protein Ku